MDGKARRRIQGGQELVLRTESGGEYPCTCGAIERFKDGSGRPAEPDEFVSILLSFAEGPLARLKTLSDDDLLGIVSAYPSLHENRQCS